MLFKIYFIVFSFIYEVIGIKNFEEGFLILYIICVILLLRFFFFLY